MSGEARPPILVTRPEAQGRETARALAAQGWRPVPCPLLRFERLDTAPDWGAARTLVFTSANGVRAARPPAEALALPVWCVGEATAEAARKAGFRDVRAGAGDAAALAEAMLAAGAEGPALHLRGEHGAGGLAEALAAGGVEPREEALYRMEAAESLPAAAAALLAGDRPLAAAVFSPRTARILAGLIPRPSAPLHVAAISAAAAGALGTTPLAGLRIARAPDRDAMLEAAAALLRELRGGAAR